MFHANIKQVTKLNPDFRHVVYTTARSQLVLMTLQPNEDIGLEIDQTADQLFFFICGYGQAVVDNQTISLFEHDILIVPANTEHNIVNTSEEEPKTLYRLYRPHPSRFHHSPHQARRDQSRSGH